jgi:hypothetical protein
MRLFRTRHREERLTDEELLNVRFIFCRTMGFSKKESMFLSKLTINQINSFIDLKKFNKKLKIEGGRYDKEMD